MVSDEYFKKQKELIHETKWIDDNIEKGSYCCICGNYDYPYIMELFEYHHIAGKNNSPITIPVCPICHNKLTNKQKSWDKKWIKKDNPPKIMLAFVLRGISEVLEMIANVLKDFSNKLLNGEI